MIEVGCDDCGSPIEIDLVDYLKHREDEGTFLCESCKYSVLRRVTRPEARTATV